MATRKKKTARKPAARKKPAPRRSAPKGERVWTRAFLAALRETGNVRLACAAAKVDRSTAYDRRNADPVFAAAWDAAREEAADLLEEEARRRAHDGVARLKFHQGEPIMVPVVRGGEPVLNKDGEPVLVPYVEHEYSDTLLIFLLKGARPEKFREHHKHELSGPQGGPIPVQVTADVLARIDQYTAAFAELAASSPDEGGAPGDGPGEPAGPGPVQGAAQSPPGSVPGV